jgi:hypothetical protein
MIAHVVLFRLKTGLTKETREGLAKALSRAASEIPSIRGARLGTRVTVGRSYEQLLTTDYPLAAILEFDDVTALKAYLDHPVHAELAQRFFASVEQTLMYDFEFWATDEGIRRIDDLVK